MSFVGVVRAEFLRCRNFEYVMDAKVMGLADVKIIYKHILPNAMTAALDPESRHRYPHEFSGGPQQRIAKPGPWY